MGSPANVGVNNGNRVAMSAANVGVNNWNRVAMGFS